MNIIRQAKAKILDFRIKWSGHTILQSLVLDLDSFANIKCRTYEEADNLLSEFIEYKGNSPFFPAVPSLFNAVLNDILEQVQEFYNEENEQVH